MRNTPFILGFLVLSCGILSAQQELPQGADDGPLVTRPVAKAQTQPARPDYAPAVPDAAPPRPDDGVYMPGPGVVLPRLLDLVTLPYPDDAPAANLPRLCIVSLVVGADGAPSDIRVLHSINSVADEFVVASTRKMHFDAGIVSGRPAPVRISMSFHFATDTNSARPRIMMRLFDASRVTERAFDKAPVPTHWAAAAYSDEARRKKINGTVLVSVLVTQDGMPTDERVVKGWAMGWMRARSNA